MGTAGSHRVPQRAFGAVFRCRAARRSGRRLRLGGRGISAGGRSPSPGRGDPHLLVAATICPEDRDGALRPARPGQPRRYLAPPRPAPRRTRARAAAGSRRSVGDRDAPAAGLPAAESSRRPWLGVRFHGLSRQSQEHLAGSHRGCEAGAGVGQGEHRRVRRRSRFRCHQRRFGRRSARGAGRADSERPAVPARVRRCRHLGGGRRSGLRPLRLGFDRRRGPAGVHRLPAEVRGQETLRR